MKWAIAIIVIVVAACILLYAHSVARQPASQTTLHVGNTSYKVSVMDNIASRAKGLSGTLAMPADTGMLFVFPSAAPQSFWMYDMRFPLDVLWIRDGVVIGLQENIAHPAANNGEIISFQSPERADMVLEINAGQIVKQGIKVGDQARLIN